MKGAVIPSCLYCLTAHFVITSPKPSKCLQNRTGVVNAYKQEELAAHFVFVRTLTKITCRDVDRIDRLFKKDIYLNHFLTLFQLEKQNNHVEECAKRDSHQLGTRPTDLLITWSKDNVSYHCIVCWKYV